MVRAEKRCRPAVGSGSSHRPPVHATGWSLSVHSKRRARLAAVEPDRRARAGDDRLGRGDLVVGGAGDEDEGRAGVLSPGEGRRRGVLVGGVRHGGWQQRGGVGGAGAVAEVDGAGLEDVAAGRGVGQVGVRHRAGAGAPVVGLRPAGQPALEPEGALVAVGDLPPEGEGHRRHGHQPGGVGCGRGRERGLGGRAVVTAVLQDARGGLVDAARGGACRRRGQRHQAAAQQSQHGQPARGAVSKHGSSLVSGALPCALTEVNERRWLRSRATGRRGRATRAARRARP